MAAISLFSSSGMITFLSGVEFGGYLLGTAALKHLPSKGKGAQRAGWPHYALLQQKGLPSYNRIGININMKRVSRFAASGCRIAALRPSLKANLTSPMLPTTLQKSRM